MLVETAEVSKNLKNKQHASQETRENKPKNKPPAKKTSPNSLKTQPASFQTTAGSEKLSPNSQENRMAGNTVAKSEYQDSFSAKLTCCVYGLGLELRAETLIGVLVCSAKHIRGNHKNEAT